MAGIQEVDGGIIFTPNPDLEKELPKLPGVIKSAEDVADAIAQRARDTAPVQTGAFRDSIIAQKVNSKGVARVISTDPKGSFIEFGTSIEPARFIFRNAVESLGLKFKKSK